MEKIIIITVTSIILGLYSQAMLAAEEVLYADALRTATQVQTEQWANTGTSLCLAGLGSDKDRRINSQITFPDGTAVTYKTVQTGTNFEIVTTATSKNKQIVANQKTKIVYERGRWRRQGTWTLIM